MPLAALQGEIMKERKPIEPSAREVLAAVVHDARAELQLNNPDYRAIGRMFADAFQAMTAAHSVLGTEYSAARPSSAEPSMVDRQTAEPEIHAAAAPELRTRISRKGAKAQSD